MNKGRRYSQGIKSRAKELRRKGLTHREISVGLGVALGTAHLWTKGIFLSSEQKVAVQERRYKPTFTEERRRRLSQLARKNFARFWKKPYSKDELLNKIRHFHLQHRRIPLKREFNMYEEYKKHFGSWNNAITLAGFEPNQVIFSKKFTAEDGHICDSFAEKIIDDWLFKHQIMHNRHVPYKNSKMTSDFAINEIRIEYFGLVGEIESYDEIIKKKRNFCQKQGLKLIEVYPSDLFSRDYRFYLRKIVEKIKN